MDGSRGNSPDVAALQKGRGGFTIMEMLVIVAILSVLAMIVTPSLVRAREMACFAVCQSRLRQWGRTFQLYAADYRSFYPHMDGLDRDQHLPDRCGWVDVLPPMIGLPRWRDHTLWNRPREATFFQCPSAQLSESKYSYRPLREGYFSYAMNSCLELDDRTYRPLGESKKELMPSFLNTHLIVRPGEVVLLFDQLLDPDEAFGGQGRDASAGQHCGSYPKDFAVRHAGRGADRGGSILFCDESVKWFETVWKDDWPANMNCPPRNDTTWFPYPP